MTGALPSLSGIQTTSLVLIAASSLLLWIFDSTQASLGCVLGGAVMVANLFILALLVRLLASAAAGGRGARLAAVALPLKLILIAGLVYLVFARAGVDAVGFAIGISTQLVAIFVETARTGARMRKQSVRA